MEYRPSQVVGSLPWYSREVIVPDVPGMIVPGNADRVFLFFGAPSGGANYVYWPGSFSGSPLGIWYWTNVLTPNISFPYWGAICGAEWWGHSPSGPQTILYLEMMYKP